MNETTTPTSDGQGNVQLTPTPLVPANTQTPGYTQTYTITYSYGAQNTPIALNQTPTPTFTGFAMTEKQEKGDGTLTTLTDKTTFKTEWELQDELKPIYEKFENLGLIISTVWDLQICCWLFVTIVEPPK